MVRRVGLYIRGIGGFVCGMVSFGFLPGKGKAYIVRSAMVLRREEVVKWEAGELVRLWFHSESR